MSPERKHLFLSQLREKRAEAKRQKNLHQSNSTAALTISTSSLSLQQASKPTNVPCTSSRREHIVTCLSTFDLGIEENRDNLLPQEQSFDRNLRRRTRYAQMSPERKELFLSQLREKKAESKRQKSLRQSNSTVALTITAFSLSPQQRYLSIFFSSFYKFFLFNMYSYI
uniref:Putative ovule protein n=1 Tax=Solanum chacoense TaxID=4108 RepID=A0A0V0J0U5_SOLCH